MLPVKPAGSMLKRAMHNFGVIIRGRVLAGLFSVAATGLMANALPVAEFGLIVLVHTYVLVIRGALNFKTFEAVVRFGIPLNDSGDKDGLRSLLRSTMLVDYSAGIFATLVAIAAAPLAGSLLHWNSETLHWAMGYSLVILATANGTPNGILRVYDRFDALGVQCAVAPALRFLLIGIAWWLDAPMEVFMVAWGSAFALGHVYMSVRGFIELRRHIETRLWQGFGWTDLTRGVPDCCLSPCRSFSESQCWRSWVMSTFLLHLCSACCCWLLLLTCPVRHSGRPLTPWDRQQQFLISMLLVS